MKLPQAVEDFWKHKPISDRPRLNPAIHAALGPFAVPTGGIRIVRTKGSNSMGKLQYEWMGYGTGWFDVPVVESE